MDISDRNLLEIICRFIDDKQTFAAFTRSSKTCWKIARKLTPIKKREFKHIDLNLVYSGLARHVTWNGCYSKGISSHQRTQVWFYPCGLEVVYDIEILMKDYDDKFEIHHYGPDSEYLGFSCQLRHPCFDWIMDDLQNAAPDSCCFISDGKKELGKLQNTYYQVNLEMDKFTQSLEGKKLMVSHDCGYILTIWIVRNLEAVIEELQKVRDFCYKNGLITTDSDEE